MVRIQQQQQCHCQNPEEQKAKSTVKFSSRSMKIHSGCKPGTKKKEGNYKSTFLAAVIVEDMMA